MLRVIQIFGSCSGKVYLKPLFISMNTYNIPLAYFKSNIANLWHCLSKGIFHIPILIVFNYKLRLFVQESTKIRKPLVNNTKVFVPLILDDNKGFIFRIPRKGIKSKVINPHLGGYKFITKYSFKILFG